MGEQGIPGPPGPVGLPGERGPRGLRGLAASSAEATPPVNYLGEDPQAQAERDAVALDMSCDITDQALADARADTIMTNRDRRAMIRYYEAQQRRDGC